MSSPAPAIDVGEARIVALDCLERAAELETSITARIMADTAGFRFDGGTVPPQGHPYRSDFESWAESAGCSDGRRGFQAPKFPSKDGRLVGLWTVAKGKWTDGPRGPRSQWAGEAVSFEDWTAEDPDRADRVAADIRALLEIRRFAAHPPTDAELTEGWGPPSSVALERHEADILSGHDPDFALPADVADWLRKLVHPPKAAYAADYCRHRLYGDPEPADPGQPWAVKARKRADRILETTNKEG